MRSEPTRANVGEPHTFWLIMSSLDVGLGGGDDMVKAFGKQPQTTVLTAAHPCSILQFAEAKKMKLSCEPLFALLPPELLLAVL